MQLLLLFLLIGVFLALLSAYLYKRYQESLSEKEKISTELNKLKQETEVLQSNSRISVDEQKLKTLLEHLPFGLLLTDEKGLVNYINPQTEVFLGISFSQLINKNLSQLLKFSDTNKKEFSDTQLLTDYQNWLTPNKLEFQTAEKSIWLQLRIVRYEARDVTYYLWVLGNLDDTNEQIIKMQSFYSQAAHDLKTPISVIRSVVELLLGSGDKLEKEKQLELIRDSKTQIELLQSLVEDILNIARLEQGKIQPNIKPVLLNTAIANSLTKHEALFRKKSLGIDFNAAESSSVQVQADMHLLQTIVDNLLSNAIKYTFAGTISITVGHENLHILLNVADSGVGIDKEHQRLLFKIYQQVGEARNLPTEKSTGLGLFIAREMARLMHGDIVLTSSAPGQGSTFTLKLPAA